MPAPMTMTRSILTLAGQCQYCQLHTSTLECILTPKELAIKVSYEHTSRSKHHSVQYSHNFERNLGDLRRPLTV